VERTWPPHFGVDPFGCGDEGACAPAPAAKKKVANPIGIILEMIICLSRCKSTGDLAKPTNLIPVFSVSSAESPQ
jgi:hypothetical protein